MAEAQQVLGQGGGAAGDHVDGRQSIRQAAGEGGVVLDRDDRGGRVTIAQRLGDAAAARSQLDNHPAGTHLANRQSQLTRQSSAAGSNGSGLPEMGGGLTEEVDGLADGHAKRVGCRPGQPDASLRPGAGLAGVPVDSSISDVDAANLPLMPDGSLPPAMLLLRWLERHGAPRLHLASLPPGNHVLPDLLRLGGVDELVLDNPPRPCLRWEGTGGARLLVRSPTDATPAEDAALHCGALPSLAGFAGWDAGPLMSLYELARLEDASAAVGAGEGAAWEGLLAAGRWADDASRPPVAALTGRGGEGLGAWNPLALARPCLIALQPNGPRAPWSLSDDRGARHPVQPSEGALGPTWLVQVPLGPLGGTTLTPHDEPATGSHWEVSVQVIDNGRVRLELDALGQIARLCWDGVFADLSGPACAPAVDGLPLVGEAGLSVLEDGPVRARVAVRREGPEGRLDLTYTLHAHEDHVRVSATWSGASECWLDHATAQRAAELHLANEGARWRVAQAASVVGPAMESTPGVRWACLADTAGKGLAVVAGRPLCVHANAGHLRVRAAPSAAWAIAAPRRLRGALSLGQLAEHLAVPGRSLPSGIAVPRPFQLAELGSLVPLWVGRPAGWSGELLLAEQAGARTRARLLPHTPHGGGECWKVDARGARLAPCPVSPEGDGWQLDAAPGEVLLVRWRLPAPPPA